MAFAPFYPSMGMSLITESELLEAGWKPGQLPELWAELRRVEAQGVSDPAYALRRLKRIFPIPDKALRPRPEPLSLAEAIQAETKEEKKNLDSVRRLMRELLRCPVIEAGSIMPDACPTAGGDAAMPVGGAIVVREAIIPAAHGSDICCSLHASFFPEPALGLGESLEALMASTRFGPGGRPDGEWREHRVTNEPGKSRRRRD